MMRPSSSDMLASTADAETTLAGVQRQVADSVSSPAESVLLVAEEPEDDRLPCRARLAKASGVSRQIRGTTAKTSPASAKVDVWRGKHPGCLLPACGRLTQKGCKEACCATAGVIRASLIVDSGGNAQLEDRAANCALRRATVHAGPAHDLVVATSGQWELLRAEGPPALLARARP
jgi:hypothetical protein